MRFARWVYWWLRDIVMNEPKCANVWCRHPRRDHFKPSPFRDGTCQWMGCLCGSVNGYISGYREER